MALWAVRMALSAVQEPRASCACSEGFTGAAAQGGVGTGGLLSADHVVQVGIATRTPWDVSCCKSRGCRCR